MTGLVRRLERLKKLAAPASAAAAAPLPPPSGEVAALARRAAQDLHLEFEVYVQMLGWTPEDARAQVTDPVPGLADQARQAPPSAVTWRAMRALVQSDPAAALQKWQEMRQAALEGLHDGTSAAEAVGAGATRPSGMAKFLSLREELAAAWQPRDGQERMLVDDVAQIHSLLELWYGQLFSRTTFSNVGGRRGRDGSPQQDPQRSIEDALRCIGRLHDLKLRAIKALRDLWRVAPRVVVHRAAQVNVGERQVNVAAAQGGAGPGG